MLAALGVLRAGGVIVPLNTRFKGGEAAYILRNAGATLLVTVRGFLGFDYPAMLGGEDVGATATDPFAPGRRCGRRRRAAGPGADRRSGRVPRRPASGSIQATTSARAAAVRPDDMSDLIFTSGTTGYPKGAVTTHAQSLRTFGTWASIVGLGSGDRYLIVNPFFHTFGYKAGILACLMAGATVVPEPVFDAGAVMRRIEAERISVLPGPPTLYQTLLGDPEPRQARSVLAAPRRDRCRRRARRARACHGRRARVHDRADRLRAHRVVRDGDDVPPQRPARDHRRHVGTGDSGPRGARRRRAARRSQPANRARSSSAATPSCRGTGATRRRPQRRSTPTDGSTRATSA